MATPVTNEAESEQSQRTTWATSAGEPFEYYDLGHGYCTYSLFALCPQRMACARCDFYLPEDSSSAQPLEANDSLQRMLVEIPLTEEESAAAQNDQQAVARLIHNLRDVATPAEPTPRQIEQQPQRPSMPASKRAASTDGIKRPRAVGKPRDPCEVASALVGSRYLARSTR
jgi:hypothetical protein